MASNKALLKLVSSTRQRSRPSRDLTSLKARLTAKAVERSQRLTDKARARVDECTEDEIRRALQRVVETRAPHQVTEAPDQHEDIDALAVPDERRPARGAPVRRLLGYLVRQWLCAWVKWLER